MKRFFQRKESAKDTSNNGRSSNDASFIPAAAAASSSATTQSADVSMPSRKQRMQLLKSIIHHADAVQKQFLVPKQGQKDNKQSKSNNLFGNDDSAEVNNKCYQRWHEILQDGLVPLSVRALNLLEKTDPTVAVQNGEDEEEAYFATLEGMEQEIQVMAILARAAALNDIDHDIEEEGGSNVNDFVQGGHNEMEQINCSMKCIAMLLFHVVLESSSVGSSESESDNSASSEPINKTVPGYDGRVRHVMKLACVDLLSRAIVSSVEAYDQRNSEGKDNENEDQTQQSRNFDFGDNWNVKKIKSFLELEDLGREAIFGTPWKPSSESKESKLIESDEVNKSNLEGNESESDTEDENIDSESGDEMQEQALTSDPKPQACEEDFDNTVAQTKSGCLETEINDRLDSNHEEEDNISEYEQKCQSKIEPSGVEADLPSKRQLNAKFLATRKYELIERLVAIDIVRFLMAEEREKKLRDQKLEEQKKKIPKLPVFLRNSISEEEDADLHVHNGQTQDGEADQPNEEQDPDENASSRYFTARRIQRIKRGAKIATAGLAIGTVFAITGGLAAPALAAGIGGIAALTGATTASSTALLAVLATFKAGALLFGAGGGGIAAYKMKKRTAGLSQFEVRRENIEQYMYQGASEEKMKRGIAAMLPQLHTTVAVTGWLRENDIADFQLAWGCQPTCQYEQADDFTVRIRQLRRFYSIFNPPLVHLCEDFMLTLKSRLKKDFSWERIWMQLEQKYGANPDHMIPLDTPRENEVFLSSDEKAMIDGVLNTAKVSNLAKKGLGGACEAFEFNENDEIADLLTQATTVSETTVKRTVSSEPDIESSTMENELDGSITCIDEYQPDQQMDSSEWSTDSSEGRVQSLQERMSSQRDKQVLFLKQKGLIQNNADLNEGEGSPKIASSVEDDNQKDEDMKAADKKDEDYNDGRCPVVWDWNRLYATDIHTVTWESKMLSSLCHIVENMAIEVSTQATKVALQFSVIGAIVSAVAIPSALLTATKLIDDPYQIVILRADEAGRELAKCLLQSDERRPVTLVGFSFGARVIYSCLRELAHQQDIWEQTRFRNADDNNEGRKSKTFGKKKASISFEYDREPASLIADVIFIGLPRVIDKKVLTSCRRVTGGRLVNCYTKNDWLLSLMFMARAGIPAGVREVRDVPGVENFDVTHFVESHTRYADAIPSILQHVRFSEP
mmetsp:Transcript_33092/g.67585  ORF Transcript_33092/g.67585 Transcript_33092/m.67585 type:complete len:1195 (-) Transcript_33092:142-3726(-)